MTHEHFQEQISSFVDHELPHNAEPELFSHLSSCEACREYFASVLKLRSSFVKDVMSDSLRGKGLKEANIHPAIHLSAVNKPAVRSFVKRKLSLPLAAVLAAFVLTVAASIGVSSKFFRTEKIVEREVPHTVYVMQLPEVVVKGYYLASSSKENSTKND
ncbi:MAG: zf-HC2 domain-containing protein [Bacteroidota bacterium]|nr:zf-HC2 domain-containing protein [Bacteroidota bacterium]